MYKITNKKSGKVYNDVSDTKAEAMKAGIFGRNFTFLKLPNITTPPEATKPKKATKKPKESK